MRLVDADKIEPHEQLESFSNGQAEFVMVAYMDDIDALPTVDAVPVRHGQWVHHPEIGWGSTWLCSECGEKTVEAIMGEPRYKFCPMCGADMRKDGDGNG